MIILISGLSGSGKSYLAENLGKRIHYKVVHASDLFKQILKDPKALNIKHTKMNLGWYELSNMDNNRKKNKQLDLLLDKYLLSVIKKEKNLIVDSWTMPYLSKAGTKIWLNASVNERAKRMSLRDKIPLKEAQCLIKKKDTFSKNQFRKLYGFNYGKDLSIYDYILETDDFSIKQVCDNAYFCVKELIDKKKIINKKRVVTKK